MLLEGASCVDSVIQKIQQSVLSTLRPARRNIPKGQPWIGLAISGGVDSMALAAICSDLHRHDSRFRGAFLGYVVDHGVREGSGDEARKVAAEIEKMGISAQVLDLAWGDQDPKVASNFETLARKLRYRALGTACRDARVGDLVVAHHADDQAETVLSRIFAGYTGSGLRGMKWNTRIPECEGVYGIDASGGDDYSISKSTLKEDVRLAWYESRRGIIEHGGISLRRPLLPFKKRELIQICQAKGVKWVEDQTNSDKTLTNRNTIRFLMKNGALPRALKADSLRRIAAEARTKNQFFEKDAKRLFDALEIDLYVCTGKAVVRTSDEALQISDRSRGDVYRIKATLLRKLLLLVSPCNEIDLQDLDRSMDLVFPEAAATPVMGSRQPAPVQIAGVNVLRQPGIAGEHKLILTRAIPTKSETQECVPIPPPDPLSGYTPWLLWDSRYWLRLRIKQNNENQVQPSGRRQDFGPAKEHVSFEVRFLTPDLIGEIRKKLGKLPDYDKIPQPERWTVPVILAHRGGNLIHAALPTASMLPSRFQSLRSASHWPYGTLHCRFKHVGFAEDSSRGRCVIGTLDSGKPKDNVMDKPVDQEAGELMRHLFDGNDSSVANISDMAKSSERRAGKQGQRRDRSLDNSRQSLDNSTKTRASMKGTDDL